MNKRNNVGAGPVSAQKGITLIALVITIIVMLILVGVTISMAVNGGLFDYAGKAVSETNNALKTEQQLANGGIEVDGVEYSSIDDYLNNIPASGTYTIAKKDENGMLTANATYIQGGYTATIPKGFKVSEVAAEQTITEGLVIEDEAGNQFVWIPVKDGEFERTGWMNNKTTAEIKSLNEDEMTRLVATELIKTTEFNTIEEALVGFGVIEDVTEEYTTEQLRGALDYALAQEGLTYDGVKENLILDATLDSNYTENAENDPTGLYASMVASVNTYGGFYIGRFEAGSNENRYTAKTDETVLVKKGAYPYNYVIWGLEMDEYEEAHDTYGHGAVYLSKNMYTGEEYGVTSTLCYGVQWDAALRFVKDKYNVTNSTAWGNYYDNEFDFTGKYSTDSGNTWLDATSETKPEESSWLLKTGASENNKAKNIYDLAGNVYEWTMEAHSSYDRVFRGGNTNDRGSNYPASNRLYNDPTHSNNHIGFRPALYLK